MAPGVQVQAQLVDLSGRFNLNSLVDENGKKNPVAVVVFQRLLQNLDLETKWADMAVDWIDADDLAEPDGAEDNIYSSENPPYRPPNAAMTSVSELLALKDFGSQRYERLKDYVVALPRAGSLNATPINLCTASGPLLDALFNQSQFTKAPQTLELLRKGHCWPTASDFTTQNPDAAERDAIMKRIGLGTTSQYFRLTSLVTIGTSQFALYSFLQRTNGAAPGSSQTMVLSRRFTE
jgi:general secretion pathway protein K